MTAGSLAQKLDGIEYPVRISKDIRDSAKVAGLLIVYGSSDDLIEFDGAWMDEAGCYEGGQVTIDREGIIPDFGDVEHEVEAVTKWINRSKQSVAIEALWCEEEGFSWTYKTEIPHKDFLVMEEGETYCRGMVIALADMPGVA